MASAYKRVDLEGDVLVILPVPCKSFAPWEGQPESQASDEPLPDSKDSSPECADGDGMSLEIPEQRSDEFRALASSKHLTLASPIFKRMLDGPWKEGKQVYADGFRHIELIDFDPRALSILLYIIHLKHRQIPKLVDTETLAKISVLVDFLECHEAVEPFADWWITQLEDKLPMDYNRDLVLWILISSVFAKPTIFRLATRTAILHTTGPFRTLGLPIRQIIVDKIDQQRVELLDISISTLHNLLTTLREGHRGCSFECDSMLLGALTKNMHSYQLLWPQPSEPFSGLSITGISDAVSRFTSPTWYPKRFVEYVDQWTKGKKSKARKASWTFEEPAEFGSWTVDEAAESKYDDFEAQHEIIQHENPVAQRDGPHICSLHPLLAEIGSLRRGVSGLEL